MVAARYYHQRLEPLLETGGRIILQWSCQWCYYVSCPANARVGSGKANTSTPVLNMISNRDPYFGPTNDSIAWQVAHGTGGYGATGMAETGNCFNQLKDQGFQHAYVVEDAASPYHGLTETTGNLVRAVLASFLANPRSSSVLSNLGSGPEGADLCTELAIQGDGLMYSRCHELGPEQDVPGKNVSQCAYQSYEYHRQYYFRGTREACARV